MTRHTVDIAPGVTLNIRSGNRSVVQDSLINDGFIFWHWWVLGFLLLLIGFIGSKFVLELVLQRSL